MLYTPIKHGVLTNQSLCLVLSILQIYLVNKPPSAAGISEVNAQGWKIVRKTNSWLRSKASRATVKFWASALGLLDQLFFGQSFSRGHCPLICQQAGKRFIYLFYNPPNNFSRRTHLDRSCIFCGFYRVSLYGIVKQLFNFSVTGFCKKSSFVFHDRLKV